ncbi:MAG: hypothetical protein LUD18_04910 [Lachnospiraceae bacterium]|nr:hypothetical protein [Lachnospiraceae bacterium]
METRFCVEFMILLAPVDQMGYNGKEIMSRWATNVGWAGILSIHWLRICCEVRDEDGMTAGGEVRE